MISILALVFVALTVHYWNAIHAYFFMLLGMGGWIADPLRAPRRVPAQAARQQVVRVAPDRRPVRPARPFHAHRLGAPRPA